MNLKSVTVLSGARPSRACGVSRQDADLRMRRVMRSMNSSALHCPLSATRIRRCVVLRRRTPVRAISFQEIEPAINLIIDRPSSLFKSNRHTVSS